MTPEYSRISLKYSREYKELLRKWGSRASDYSFGNIWGWGEHYGLEWRYHAGLCWIRQTSPEELYWAPVGDWKNYDWAAAPCLDEGRTFIRVPDKLAQTWSAALPGRVEIIETRGQWDYLYDVGELASLSGNRFHKKKNLLNQFRKLYEYEYYPMSSDCVESVLDMQAEWSKWREVEDSPTLLAENAAIARVLELWDDIPGLVGGAIHVDGAVVAYTVGEEVCPGTMVVHFEKGMPSYKGVYQAINNHFAKELAETGKITYLNREQDLDDEGLRKAKESYNPVDYVKKHKVIIKPKT